MLLWVFRSRRKDDDGGEFVVSSWSVVPMFERDGVAGSLSCKEFPSDRHFLATMITSVQQ